MPLFGHSKHDDEPGDGGRPDFDALLAHFDGLPLDQRAAEVLAGISAELPHGEREAMDRLLGHWLGDQ